MTDISCGARSVRARMEHYFRTEDLIETLTQQVAAVEQQVTALEAWIASDAIYPSQGVAQYTPGRGRRGAVSDPTAGAAHLHLRNTADLERELRELRRRRAVDQYALGRALDEVAPMRVVLLRLPELDRKIIDLRWGQVRHGRRPSLEEIAASTGVDSTTVKRHISALGSTVPVAVDHLRSEAQRN